METVDWPQTGDRVRGAYLGHPFEGLVTGVGFEQAQLAAMQSASMRRSMCPSRR
jgi:hypothetical protein